MYSDLFLYYHVSKYTLRQRGGYRLKMNKTETTDTSSETDGKNHEK